MVFFAMNTLLFVRLQSCLITRPITEPYPMITSQTPLCTRSSYRLFKKSYIKSYQESAWLSASAPIKLS